MSDKLKPDWAGDDLLSRFVNLMIQTKPVYRLMKHQARQVIINTAEKNGIAWQESCQTLEKSPAKALLPQITNPNVNYPDYYLVPFHAYDEGNLCWQAAFEAVPATQSLGIRVWKGENLPWYVAQSRLRGSFHQILDPYSPPIVRNILDVGCSVGISTKELHRYYLKRQDNQPIQTIGLDLSPYMLAVAKVTDEKAEIAQWIHGLAEKTEFADNSFDVITLQFVLHELPRHASKAIFKEVKRILRPGGVFGIVDNNPGSTVIQNLPPALFMLMKSTEPWSDDYYTFNVEQSLIELGFNYQTTVPSDHRHRTIVATKPL
ncbi:class I SAM-dependent methyltransferase [Crocosphaera sp. UHCC 0190]|uniref:class I SAM-dependent methyltransferase n=1 Tax=Crocosphaera sp. UHCC 0190 TaxID=3110246 RepID=UPI002B1E9941|nr:class I SAM-dependent methyltransferase [Crocosphaera sp. UHCC 0190]MEA5509342.1 class I SAM-dependent methyltransferase [Crocosphaera sp. UHCC 0190]